MASDWRGTHEHPLDQAQSPTLAQSGLHVYVVCGFRGCAQRLKVDAAVWEAERARRQAQSAMVQVWHARGDRLVPVAPDVDGLVPDTRDPRPATTVTPHQGRARRPAWKS